LHALAALSLRAHLDKLVEEAELTQVEGRWSVVNAVQ